MSEHTRSQRRVFIYTPLIASGVIGGLAVSSTIKARGYEEGSFEFWLIAISVLLFLCVFVMTPLLILSQILEKDDSDNVSST